MKKTIKTIFILTCIFCMITIAVPAFAAPEHELPAYIEIGGFSVPIFAVYLVGLGLLAVIERKILLHICKKKTAEAQPGDDAGQSTFLGYYSGFDFKYTTMKQKFSIVMITVCFLIPMGVLFFTHGLFSIFLHYYTLLILCLTVLFLTAANILLPILTAKTGHIEFFQERVVIQCGKRIFSFLYSDIKKIGKSVINSSPRDVVKDMYIIASETQSLSLMDPEFSFPVKKHRNNLPVVSLPTMIKEVENRIAQYRSGG